MGVQNNIYNNNIHTEIEILFSYQQNLWNLKYKRKHYTKLSILFKITLVCNVIPLLILSRKL